MLTLSPIVNYYFSQSHAKPNTELAGNSAVTSENKLSAWSLRSSNVLCFASFSSELLRVFIKYISADYLLYICVHSMQSLMCVHKLSCSIKGVIFLLAEISCYVHALVYSFCHFTTLYYYSLFLPHTLSLSEFYIAQHS